VIWLFFSYYLINSLSDIIWLKILRDIFFFLKFIGINFDFDFNLFSFIICFIRFYILFEIWWFLLTNILKHDIIFISKSFKNVIFNLFLDDWLTYELILKLLILLNEILIFNRMFAFIPTTKRVWLFYLFKKLFTLLAIIVHLILLIINILLFLFLIC